MKQEFVAELLVGSFVLWLIKIPWYGYFVDWLHYFGRYKPADRSVFVLMVTKTISIIKSWIPLISTIKCNIVFHPIQFVNSNLLTRRHFGVSNLMGITN